MATLNKVMLMGRLTNDPEEGAIPSTGTRVVKFRFAVGRSRKNAATGQWENDPNPMFIDCEAFARPDAKRDLVSLIKQYCHKGDPLYIDGRLQLDQWDDKQTGQKRSKHKLVVENIEFLGGRGEDGGGRGAGAGSSSRFSGGGNRAGAMGAPEDMGHGGDDHGDAPGATGDPIPF
jgi:single-strand DNA-binding protein